LTYAVPFVSYNGSLKFALNAVGCGPV